MKIWIDADACPGAVKDIVVTAALRRCVETVFVANKKLLLPDSPYLSFQQVSSAADAADHFISEHADSFDLVVTQDIPLAHNLVSRNVLVIGLRGEKYTQDNIGERLSVRDLMQGLRDAE